MLLNNDIHFYVNNLINRSAPDLVVNLEAGEGWVLETDINANHVVHQSIGLVSFKR